MPPVIYSVNELENEERGMNISTGSNTDFSNEAGIDFGDKVEGAGFWIRLLARVIDVIIHYVIAFVTVIFITIVASIVAVIIDVSPDLIFERLENQVLTDYLLAMLGLVAYHTLCEGLHGATLGKLICGLVVVKEDGTHCGALPAFKRSLAFYIDGLFFGIPAVISMNSSLKRQRLGDRWAKTMVVKRSELDGSLQLRSGLRFVFVFLGGGNVGWSNVWSCSNS